MTEIIIPNNWQPRDYQFDLWEYMVNGGTRAVGVWNRRSGKDSVAVNLTTVKSLRRVGLYWHLLPSQRQSRKVIWDGIDSQGRRLIDQAFPPEIRKSINNTEMKIELKNGSIWQCVGSDNYDSLVGANPVGVVFSEYSVADPKAWDYIRPILAENGGWAVFIYTPRGRNHGYRLFANAKKAGWFTQLLTVEETHAISLEAIEEERKSGMDDDMIQQEFFCSFEAGAAGSYYGKLIEQARAQGRIGHVPYDPALSVITSWDLGIGDSTVIWFWQVSGSEVRAIDYYESSGVGLDHYIKLLNSKPYIYSQHIGPHDIEVREMGTGKSRKEIARELGVTFTVAPNLPIDDGINAVRQLLPRLWIDDDKCERGIDALLSYHREYDDRLHDYKASPLHDWSSHSADAARMFAVSNRLLRSEDYRAPDRYSKTHKPDRNWRTA